MIPSSGHGGCTCEEAWGRNGEGLGAACTGAKGLGGCARSPEPAAGAWRGVAAGGGATKWPEPLSEPEVVRRAARPLETGAGGENAAGAQPDSKRKSGASHVYSSIHATSDVTHRPHKDIPRGSMTQQHT